MTKRFVCAGLALVAAACSGGDTMDGGVAEMGADLALDMPVAVDLGPDAPCVDSDGDGHGAQSCGGDDCDDTNPQRYPGRAEVCDSAGVDEDCDPTTLGPDHDGDGSPATACCDTQADGSLRCGTDCDDTKATVNVTAVESCNGVDDDCDGMVDEGVLLTFCFDHDGDGHGDLATAMQGCALPVGATAICNDCDDADASRYPGAAELCHGVDANCNGVVDDGCACSPTGTTRACGSSVGACVAGTQTCLGGVWESSCGGATAPVVEVCNGADDDCDGTVDEGLTFTFYPDCDGDGYGMAGAGVTQCAAPPGAPPGCAHGTWGTTGGDCNDHDATLFPGAGCTPLPVDGGPGIDMGAGVDMGVAPPDSGSSGTDSGPPVDLGPGCSPGTCPHELVSLALGGDYSCGVRRSGAVACWGGNSYGSLGDNTTTPRTAPVPSMGATAVARVAAGAGQTCVVDASGGTVACWGAGTSGQLGDGMTFDEYVRSSTVVTGATLVAAGTFYSCAAVGAPATVGCWGANMYGNLGDGTTTPRSAWAGSVPGISGATSLSAGNYFACAVAGGQVLCWGRTAGADVDAGGPGLDAGVMDTLTPTAVTGISNAVSVSVGNNHACALRADGTVSCWGRNNYGQLGDGSTSDSPTPVTVPLSTMPHPTTIAVGGDHSCAIDGTGTVQCWGDNSYGQLGDGTTTTSSTPVVALPGAVALAAGGLHTCAIKNDGTTWCWGADASGQLGDGTTVPMRRSPVMVVDP